MSDINILDGSAGALRELLGILNERDKAAGEAELLRTQHRGLCRDIESIDRHTQEIADGAVKKRRDEIIANMDKAIAKEEDKAAKARTEREKALHKGKKARMTEETFSLKEDNRRLRAEKKAVMKDKRLPLICGSKIFLAVFAPRGFFEKLIFILVMFGLYCVLPYGIFLLIPPKEPIVLAGIYSGLWIILSFLYLPVNNFIKIHRWDTIKSIRNYRKQIEENNRRILEIRGFIKKDTNDSVYNLTDYDTRISTSEAELLRLKQEKEKALSEFENKVVRSITEAAEKENEGERNRLTALFQKVKVSLDAAEKKEDEYAKKLETEYAGLGSELLTKQAVTELLKIMEEGGADTVRGAVSIYKGNPAQVSKKDE